mmetsp:Transcript_41571/g.115666  ORF Transcript_41571/g.115666 Transcript_41571/m.115666 type:complete len:214 (+) Transcript_41571:14-655(+)
MNWCFGSIPSLVARKVHCCAITVQSHVQVGHDPSARLINLQHPQALAIRAWCALNLGLKAQHVLGRLVELRGDHLALRPSALQRDGLPGGQQHVRTECGPCRSHGREAVPRRSEPAFAAEDHRVAGIGRTEGVLVRSRLRRTHGAAVATDHVQLTEGGLGDGLQLPSELKALHLQRPQSIQPKTLQRPFQDLGTLEAVEAGALPLHSRKYAIG